MHHIQAHFKIIKVMAAAAVFSLSLLLAPTLGTADDTNLFSLGGGTAGWPSTLVFAFDSSGSMTNLVCRDFPGAYGGDCTSSGHWYAKNAPNGATICGNDVFDLLVGPDQDGDNIRDPFNPPYDADGVTFIGQHYDILNTKGSGDNDDLHAPYMVYQHDSIHSWVTPTWSKMGDPPSTATTSQARFEQGIEDACDGLSTCERRNRCIYSLRTQGYFSERNSSCGSGDPYGYCNCVTSPPTPPGPIGTCTPSGPTTQRFEAESMQAQSGRWYIRNWSGYSNGQSRAMDVGDRYGWVQFNNPMPSGSFTVHTRLRAHRIDADSIRVRLYINGTIVSTVYRWVTGDWHDEFFTWNNINIDNGDTVRIQLRRDNADDDSDEHLVIDYIELTGSGTTCPPEPSVNVGDRVQAENMVNTGWTDAGSYMQSNNGSLLTFLVTVPADGVYTMRGRVYGSGTGSNSFYVDIGSDPGSSSSYNAWSFSTWTWYTDDVNANNGGNPDPRQWVLSAGTYRVYIRNRESGSRLDWIEVVDTGSGLLYCSGAPAWTHTSQTSQSGSTSSSRRAYLGEWLNFYPPKYVSAVSVFKSMVDDIDTDIRVGITEFGDIWDSRLHDVYPRDVLPTCANVGNDCKDDSDATACLTSSLKTDLKNGADSINFNNGTPLARMLNHVADIYTDTSASSPFCDNCMTQAFTVVMTDGFPSGDTNNPSNLPVCNNLMTGFVDGLAYSNGSMLDEIAYCMAHQDMRADLSPLDQNVKTYTITFGLMDTVNPDECVALLKETAQAGRGECFPAYDTQSLEDSLKVIIEDIQDASITFTAPAVPGVRGAGGTTVTTAIFTPICFL
jgi:hypothetical protein